MSGPLGAGRCREILGLGPGAGADEARQAIHLFRRLWGPGADPLGGGAMDEFSEEARARVLAEAEAAYQELAAGLESSRPAAHVPVQAAPDAALDGPGLRRLREGAGLSLADLSAETHVRQDYLDALEREAFGELPAAPVFVRGFVSAALAALGTPSEAAVSAYMTRHPGNRGGR